MIRWLCVEEGKEEKNGWMGATAEAAGSTAKERRPLTPHTHLLPAAPSFNTHTPTLIATLSSPPAPSARPPCPHGCCRCRQGWNGGVPGSGHARS